MTASKRPTASPWKSLVLATFVLVAAGGCSGSAYQADAALASEAGWASEAGTFPPGSTVSTCQDYGSVTVGSYIVQSNYWHKNLCPGTQCMDINQDTGAFRVTKGPDPCGDTVSSYPNVLYGCSFGNCSPQSMLPMQVGALSTVTSSWDFSVTAAANDKYDVAYDIWFCPDQGCGASGFPGGVELMIWLDYKNLSGWQYDLGKVSLAGHTWEVWKATMGSGPGAWTYLAYMIQPPMVTSVADLDLGAFFGDMAKRGFIKDAWYLYAIQAGNELRTGAIPYDNNSFSVSINGVTPTTTPASKPDAAAAGPVCDGGMPAIDGGLSVGGNYVNAGPLHGYASAWTWVGGGSNAVACITPTCTAPGSLGVAAILNNGVTSLTAEPVSCSPAFAPSALCTAGSVTADPTYNQVAGLGFNLNQDRAAGTTSVDGGAAFDGGPGLDAGADLDGALAIDAAAALDGGGAMGGVTIDNSIAVSVALSGASAGNASLRVQLTDVNGTFYCYGGRLQSGQPIPIGQFNTQCWSGAGQAPVPGTQFKRVDVLVPGSASTEESFSFCLTNVVIE